jgi:hypothetical protein
MTLGPDNIWLFRWPLRMIEYSWVGLSVCLALVLSAGLARDHLPRRAWATAAVVAGGFFLAWSSTPEDWLPHLGWAAGTGALVAGTVAAVRSRGLRALPVMAVLGTMIVTPGQAATSGWDYRKVTKDLDLGRVSDLNAVRGAGETYRGTVLQLADVKRLDDPEATTSGHLAFGHMLAAAGHDTLNRYTGIGFSEFMSNMSLNYRGSLRNDWSVPALYADVPGGRYDTSLVDALGIDTLVLSTRDHEAEDYRPKAGWRTVLRDEHRTVLQRRSIPAPGPTVTPAPGVTVLAAEDTGDVVRLTVESTEGGTVLLDRLAWPGYRAGTPDGAAVPVGKGPIGLLELTVPSGTTTIEVGYEVPGLRTGLTAAAAVTVLALLHQLLWWSRRPAHRRVPARPARATGLGTAKTSAPVTLPSQKSPPTPARAEPRRPTT